jgi:D-3-phosphoglycerate dehydrogenase
MPPAYAPLLNGIAIAVGPEESALSGAHAIIAGAHIRYDGAFMDRIPTLRVIARTGIGVDNISLPDATTRGIAICNTPDAPTTSTAEFTIALLLAATKHLKKIEYARLNGQTRNFFSEYEGVELFGLRLGLVGLGRIGARVAKVALALGMIVQGYDPYVPLGRAADLGVELLPDLDTLLRTSDVVSLHAPASPETHHLLDAERLAMMKPGAYLINTARGSLVDEAALLDALRRGHLAGAGLDVLDPEPPDPANPLLYRDDVFCTPHVGGITVASKDALWREALRQTMQVLRGERPTHLVNPEVWPLRSER